MMRHTHTITLDDDVARLVDDAMHRERRSMKAVINDALRSALSKGSNVPYVPRVFSTGLRSGIDPARLNQLGLANEHDDGIGR